MSHSLKLRWSFLGNSPSGPATMELTIRNTGDAPLPAQGWALYFNFWRNIDPTKAPAEIICARVNGDLWRLAPSERFHPIAPGAEARFLVPTLQPLSQITDMPAGSYIVFGDSTPGARAEPIVPEISPFPTDERRRRGKDDHVPAETAELLYTENAGLTLLPADAFSPITPRPQSIQARDGKYSLHAGTAIVAAPEQRGAAELLRDAVRPLLRHELRIVEAEPREPAIHLVIDAVDAGETPSPGESYELSVGSDGIDIQGASAAGIVRAIQSLRQLLPISAYLAPQERLEVPAVRIVDTPRFAYRGLHLDVARNFTTKRDVLRLLDIMAFYKLNKFHFHLTDDEGWRLAIPGLPELTEIGAKRGFTTDETDCLLPSFSSGAVADAAISAGTGHYTRADFIEILRYATARHIEVIPEIEMPGHARAAIVAMNARYRRLMAEGKPEAAREYLLADPDDRSTYRSIQGWNDNVVCIGLLSVDRFIDTVTAEMKAMYAEAGAPLTALHVGGDEVPAGIWEGSPICRRRMEEIGARDLSGLQDDFVARLLRIAREHGLIMACWEEIAIVGGLLGHAGGGEPTPNPAFAGGAVRPYIWNAVWGWGREDVAYRLANEGYPVVMCASRHLYLDLAYSNDPEEPGQEWSGFVSTRKAFDFCPLDIFAIADRDVSGRPLEKATIAAKQRLKPAARGNILGIQAELWGEHTINAERLEYFTLPRLIAVAERAWAPDPAWSDIAEPAARHARMGEDWNEFANRLGQRELPRLDGLLGGFGYRVPVPGATLRDGKLYANVEAPGLNIRYSQDGSEPTTRSTLYAGPAAVSPGARVRLAAFTRTGRRSRSIAP